MESSYMDSLTTGLAAVVVLALPFALWIKYAVRKNREQELNEIKALATQRSQWLDKLHLRFDALDKQEAQRKPMVSEDEALRLSQVREWLSAFQAATEQDLVLEKYSIALKAPDLESSRHLYRYSNRTHELHRLWFEEAPTSPEWFKDMKHHESTEPETLRRKVGQRPINRKLLQGPTPQPL
jgi:hypothetical protein